MPRIKVHWHYAIMLAAISVSPARADVPTFDELYRGVSACSFDLSRYTDVPMEPYSEAVLISLPAAGAVRGFLVNAFYFAPARGGKGENYGLVFNAPLEAVADAFPELAARETMNGHLRRLLRLSDETGERNAGGKTLLMCSGGTDT
jgi:hypothetical protein